MKYLCLLFGVLLIAGAMAAWMFYGLTHNDFGGGYAFVGAAGAIIAGLGISIHEKEMKK